MHLTFRALHKSRPVCYFLIPLLLGAAPGISRALELAPQDLATVEARTVHQTMPITGDLKAFNKFIVATSLSVPIAEVYVRVGDSVAKGQELARFDTKDLRARLAEKKANLEAERSAFRLAVETLQKKEKLQRQHLIAQTDVDNARSLHESEKAKVAALQAEVDLAQHALDDAIVRAPSDSVVAQRMVEPGQIVQAGSTLFSLVDVSQMELAASVPTSDIGRVRRGQVVSVHVDAYGQQTFSGQVQRISPVSAEGTRFIPVYIRIPNPEGLLKGGMFAQGKILLQESIGLLVPKAAVRDEGGKSFVYRINEGKVEREMVTLRPDTRGDGVVQVKAGLSAGDIVVVGLTSLQAGSSIQLPRSFLAQTRSSSHVVY